MAESNPNPSFASNPASGPMERELVVTRVFDASRDLVWKAVTASDRLRHW
jgi:uncharacterized protein YndB with AHSA1/START domain